MNERGSIEVVRHTGRKLRLEVLPGELDVRGFSGQGSHPMLCRPLFVGREDLTMSSMCKVETFQRAIV